MNNVNKNCVGRPAGKRKTKKIEVSIEPQVKDTFMQMLHEEGKSASVEIGNWIREYIKNHSKGQPL